MRRRFMLAHMHSLMMSLIVVAAAATLLAQQPTSSPRDLFERARLIEESNQNLPQAIALYAQAAADASAKSQRDLAATAQLRVGLIHERLGQRADAERALRLVISQYADQPAIVRQAETRLTALAERPRSRSEPAVRRVWADNSDGSGTPSPDGRLLSFTDWDTGDLCIRDIATGGVRRITNKGTWAESDEFAEWSVFSADGRQIAYAWSNAQNGYDLRLIPRDGGKPRILHPTREEVRFIQPHQWTADGRSILVSVALRSGSTQIAMLSVADGALRVVKTLPWLPPERMGLSPDGRFIAYHRPPRDEPRRRDIFLLAADGSREAALTEHPADDVFLGWAPDGGQILYASDRTGTMAMWTVGVSDGKPQGEPEIVRRDVGRVWPLGFTAGGVYYYSLETGTIDVHMVALDRTTGRATAAPKRLTERFAGSNTWPDFSPDGSSVAYIAKRQPGPPFFQQVIVIQSLVTGEARDLPARLSYILRVRWAPDGKSLIVNARDPKNRQGLHRVDARSGDTTPLVMAESGVTIVGPRWSGDARSFRYLQLDNAVRRVRVGEYEVATARETVVFTTTALPPVQRLALSPKADRIAFVSHDQRTKTTSLSVLAVAGGDVRTLTTATFPDGIAYGYDLLEWSADGRYLYFVQKGNASGQQIARISVDGGSPEPIGVTMPNVAGLAVHPDQSRLAFSAGRFKGEIWVMEHFLQDAKK